MKFYRSLTAVWMSVLVALVLPGPATGGVWNRHSKGAPAPHHVSSQLISKPSLSLQMSEQRALELYGRQPLTFEVNYGQADEQVRYLARGSGYTLCLTAGEAVLFLYEGQVAHKGPKGRRSLLGKHGVAAIEPGAKSRTESPKSAVLRMKLVDANPEPRIQGLDELSGRVNYFIGNDPKRWRANIPTYAKVKYENVYPGVDLVYYGRSRQLEYDFIVAPGADPQGITLAFDGVDKLDVDARGDLVIQAPAGQIRQGKPLVYQEVNGIRREVSVGYVLKNSGEVGLQLGKYDPAAVLIIDPVLSFSTYLGGSGREVDGAGGIAVRVAPDGGRNVYVVGSTSSLGFSVGGAFDTQLDGPTDAFVARIDFPASGLPFLAYRTYLGGGGSFDRGTGIAVDGSGTAYVSGHTNSSNFPITPNPGAYDPVGDGSGDAFVAKLSADGASLLYSTYLGGTGGDGADSIAIDASGDAYVMGLTNSYDFPTTTNAFDTSFNILGVECDSPDFFVVRLRPSGNGPADLLYSTFLGGCGVEGIDDFGGGIAVATSGDIYVTADTRADDFPTTTTAFSDCQQDNEPGGPTDAFVTILRPAGQGVEDLRYSTCLGGSGYDYTFRVAVDAGGNAYLVGLTDSTDFPTTMNAFDRYLDGSRDAFVARLDPAQSGPASLVYSTYLGGSARDVGLGIAVDNFRNAYVTGWTQSTNFPVANALQSTAPSSGVNDDAFVTKLNATGSALVWSSYLGGGSGLFSSVDVGTAIAVDSAGNVYVTGWTQATDFPTLNQLQSYDGQSEEAFVTWINDWRDTEAVPVGQTVSVSNAPGGTGEAGVTATLTNNSSGTGTATVTVENYSSNPGTTNVIDLGGRYVDLRVSGADSTDSVTARFYYPSTVTGTGETELILKYYDPATNTWPEVRSSGGASPLKDTTDNLDNTISGGRFTVIFDNTSTPRITQLTGTVFTSSVTPLGAIRVLVSRVGSLNLNAGQKNSLASKLEAALHSLLRGNRNAAINQLAAFVNEVQALQRTGQLGAAIAESLIGLAQAIISLI